MEGIAALAEASSRRPKQLAATSTSGGEVSFTRPSEINFNARTSAETRRRYEGTPKPGSARLRPSQAPQRRNFEEGDVSEIHAAFAAQHPVTLSRLDELLALLQENLADPAYGRALDLLKAMASPEASAALHDADAALPPAEGPPAVVDVPYVSGQGVVGATLECTMGNWTGEPTVYAYKWKSKKLDIVTDLVAQGPTYLVDAKDASKEVFCVVTATNAGGATEAPPSNAILIAEDARSRTSR
jgi:hypothetical protein